MSEPVEPNEIENCRICGGPMYWCEAPDSTCRHATEARGVYATALSSAHNGHHAIAVALRIAEDAAWERLSVATKELDRLRASIKPDPDPANMKRALEASDLLDRVCGEIESIHELVCKASDTFRELGYLEAVGRINAIAYLLTTCADMAADMSDLPDVLDACIKREDANYDSSQVEPGGAVTLESQ